MFWLGAVLGFCGCLAAILAWDAWDEWRRERKAGPRTLVYNRQTGRWEGKP